MRKRILTLLMAAVMVLSMAVTAGAEEIDIGISITDPTGLRGSDYTDIPVLAQRLDRVFAGQPDMYEDFQCTKLAPAVIGSSSVPLGHWYKVKSLDGKVYSGTSCYIYANAVYATLFGDIPYHGQPAGWHHSERAMGPQDLASYELFKSYDIRFGALMRTTPNSNGSYNSEKGHSIIILKYDENEVTFLEGNGDGHGLIRMSIRNWDIFNKTLLTNRYYKISFIVQPTAAYLDSLRDIQVPGYDMTPDDGAAPGDSPVLPPDEGFDPGDGTLPPIGQEDPGDGTLQPENPEDPGDGALQPESPEDPGTAAEPEHELVGYFARTQMYQESFLDVTPESWFYSGVKLTYELNMVSGRDETHFAPNDPITVAEGITLACRYLSRYYDDHWDFSGGENWYDPYYAYMDMWGIPLPDLDPSAPLPRAAFAELMADALPEAARTDSGVPASFPDLPTEDPAYPAVDLLARSGIMAGFNTGLFGPELTLTRAEAATVLSRMADKSLRIAYSAADDVPESPESVPVGDLLSGV